MAQSKAFADASHALNDLSHALALLESENNRLRELVPILAYCMSEDRDCDRCALNGADMPTPRISACDSLSDIMRELGVDA